MASNQNFTEGKILSPLIRFAFPVLLALFLQSMYGAADLMIVGRFGQAMDVSAVSTGSQIMQVLTTIIVGLSMGTTVLVGQRIGERREEEAGRVIGSSIVLFAALSAVMTVIMLIAAKGMVHLMQAPEEAFSSTVAYVMICSAGAVFIVAYNLLGSIFRGIGNSRIPLITVAIACVLNILGDLLFVAVFGWGAAGAALATIIAQGISVLLSFLVILRTTLPFHFSRRDIRFDRRLIGGVLRLGFPIALQDFLVNISFSVIIAIVNTLGLIASAGVGVSGKLCSFIMLVPSAFMQSMSAFVAQNIGAGKPDRARRALWIGISSSFVVGAIMGYVAFFHGDLLASFFATDPEIILAAWEYLKAYAIDCLLVAFLFCFMGYFNGCGYTTFVMSQGIIGAFLVRIPFSWIMSRLPTVSLFYVGLATPASTLVQITLCLVFYFLMRRRNISTK